MACCISCHPITGGLSVPSAHSEPQQPPSQPQRCLLASPVPSHPLCEEDLNQGKPKQCTMEPPLPPMIQLWKERGIWVKRVMRAKGAGGGGEGLDVQAFSLRKKKRGGGERCGAHANRVPLFSATGVRDSLTKAQQMDQAGPPSPQKQCAVIITTFFHTKPLCSHGHAWLHVRWRPSMSLYSSQSHTLSRALSRSTVLPRPFSSVPIPFFFFFFCCLHICVGEDICIPSVLLMHFCR